ncbi:MAG: response regulator [Endomicrobia bacterium]|nr:response regulator [Endomicrobiia bacterium]MCL2799457.1 response regulator [Endomicrobiia bacterium]
MEQEKKLNILIADDEEGLRFSLASILEIEGHTVKTAENGIKALSLVKNSDFDIAFFDIRMPEMNGVETFKEIKKIDTCIIVVMMTAYAMNDLVRESIKEGAFACISKPFEIDDILDTVKEISAKPAALIISSDSETISFLMSNLRQSGFIAINEANADKALRFIERRRPVQIFIDDFPSDYPGFAEKIKTAAGDANIVIIGNHGLQIKGAKFINKPVTKNVIAGFLKPTGKGKVAIVSPDTLSSNNLKLSIIAKGYDVMYFSSMDNFLKYTDLNIFDVVISETGVNSEFESLRKRAEAGDITGKLIIIVDYENPLASALNDKKIKFLQKSFETSELFKIMEE